MLAASYVRLEENGVLTDCSIKTQEPDETLDFSFSSTNVINKLIMKVGHPRSNDKRVINKCP